jgi:hypothetical protein
MSTSTPSPSGDAADETEVTWVTVYNAANVEEAHIVMGALEANDIPSVLRNEATSALFGAVSMGGVNVQVPEPLAERALAALASNGE